MTTNSFLRIFANSPVEPLQEHIKVVNQCSQGLLPFFTAVFASDWAKATKHQRKISKLEEKADDLKRALRKNLPSGIFMAVQRQDV